MEYAISPVKMLDKRGIQACAGGLLMALGAQISLPTVPVATTLQVLALFMLAFSLPPRVCLSAILCYLSLATMGLPVVSTGANPLWFLSPTAGYLAAYPIAGYSMSKIVHHKEGSLPWMAVAGLIALSIIYIMGSLWLSAFVGLQVALQAGVLFFLHIDCLKLGVAIACMRGYRSFFFK